MNPSFWGSRRITVRGQPGEHSKTLSQKVKIKKQSQVWWHTPIIPALGRLRQKDYKFKASLDNTAGPCIEK
jgi:hypothetical protein